LIDPTESAVGRAAWVRWVAGWPGILLAFLWGLAEGSFFFVVPDVIISLVAVVQPRRAWRHIVAAILGGVLGGAFLYRWASIDPLGAHEAVAQVPFITAKMFAQVNAGFRMHGLGAVFLGPLSGIPYKIYAIAAPEFVGRGAFLWATVPARGERFLVVWLGFGVVAMWLRRYLGRTNGQLTLVYGAFWVLFYGLYWGMIVWR